MPDDAVPGGSVPGGSVPDDAVPGGSVPDDAADQTGPMYWPPSIMKI